MGPRPKRIVELCVKAGHPEPDFDEVAGAVVVRFHPVTAQVTAQVAQVVRACDKPLSRDELQAKLGLEHREHFRKSYLVPALASGLIERTIPDKPRSRRQKYRLTAPGSAWLAAHPEADQES